MGAGGYWNDSTGDAYPDWLQVDFNGSKTINEIDVFTFQDDYLNPIEPTESTTFTLYGITHFDVQYWDGSSWVTVPNGSIADNNKVWNKFVFSPVTTTKIRVLINSALNTYSRLVENNRAMFRRLATTTGTAGRTWRSGELRRAGGTFNKARPEELSDRNGARRATFPCRQIMTAMEKPIMPTGIPQRASGI
jgi:hypothetical protein